MEPRYNDTPRGKYNYIMSKLSIQRYGCKTAENIAISGATVLTGKEENAVKRTKSKVDKGGLELFYRHKELLIE